MIELDLTEVGPDGIRPGSRISHPVVLIHGEDYAVRFPDERDGSQVNYAHGPASSVCTALLLRGVYATLHYPRLGSGTLN